MQVGVDRHGLAAKDEPVQRELPLLPAHVGRARHVRDDRDAVLRLLLDDDHYDHYFDHLDDLYYARPDDDYDQHDAFLRGSERVAVRSPSEPSVRVLDAGKQCLHRLLCFWELRTHSSIRGNPSAGM